MDPKAVFGPNLECPARGQVGRGNIVIPSQKEQRYKCKQCGQTFAATRGTAFYRLRTAVDLVVTVVTLVAYGCPLQATFGLDERTVRAWVLRAGAHWEQVHQQLVVQPRDLGQVQADELGVKQQGQRVWLASAIQGPTRLWLGGVISATRDGRLIAQLVATIRACALCRPLLIAVDGLSSYVSAIRAAYRDAGPPALAALEQHLHRASGPEGRSSSTGPGSAALVARLIHQTQGHGGLNTASIERLNATFRARLAALGRRTRALARQTATLTAGMFLLGTISNFCSDHESLRLEGLIGGRKWLPPTPAMAAGLSPECAKDHRWSVQELLAYRVPPPRWTPPKRRGRPSNEMKRLIAQWCT